MGDRPRALDNPINWSFGVGRLFGIHIRVHVLFLLGAVVLLSYSVAGGSGGPLLPRLGHGMGQMAILFLIVLLHEFGHCFGARFVGGEANEILMWPLGGLASVAPPHTARANLITALAGPMVNVAICAAVAVALMVMTGSAWAVPWNPFGFTATGAAVTSHVQWWLVTVFALSYMLLLFNLAPVFPLDGGRVLQCLLWPNKGFAEATKLATGIGMVGAIGFGILGLVSGETLLLAIALFGYFTCWQQRQMLKMGAYEAENELGYDFSKGYTSLDQGREPRRPGYFARRRAAKEARRRQRELEEFEEHRRRVDAILQKITRHGPSSLTPDERRTLERETHRQRSTDD